MRVSSPIAVVGKVISNTDQKWYCHHERLPHEEKVSNYFYRVTMRKFAALFHKYIFLV